MNKTFQFEVKNIPNAQAPWDIPGISASVKAEHVQRGSTSVDDKIEQQRLARVQLANRRSQWRSRQKLLSSETAKEGTLDGQWEQDADVPTEGASRRKRSRKGGELEALKEEDMDDDEEDAEGEEEELVDASHGLEFDGTNEDDGEDDEDDDSSDEEAEEEKTTNKGSARKASAAKVHVEEVVQARGESSRKSTFFASSKGASFNASSFSDLNLSRPLVKACEALGYVKPTPIQAACIPLAMAGRDICGSAVTGSGKTAAFALPILERLLYRPKQIPAIRVLILTPTRELAVQIQSMTEKLAQFTDIRTCLAVGGLSNKVQEASLRTNPDIVVATPGRMVDHLHNAHSIGLEDLAVLILDEADRLLEMGFQAEIHEIVRLCPRRRQTLLFSATMTSQVSDLIQLSLNNPVRLSADPTSQRPQSLTEEVVKLRSGSAEEKEAIVLALCSRTFKQRTIIFCGRKTMAHRLKIIFGLAGMKAGELHGNLTQTMRLAALEEFRTGETNFLVATDVAARGLDISGVETVISMECPREINTYVHRVGRTARAGKKGSAITLVEEKDRKLLKSLARKAGSQLKSRIVPQAAILQWSAKIQAMAPEIEDIARMESEERALRKAEMEANKAQNMVEHESEIYSKPKKVWFQSLKERRAIAEASKAEKEAAAGDAEGGNKRKRTKKVKTLEEVEEEKRKAVLKKEREKNMTRRERRKLEAKREDARADADLGDEEASSKVPKVNLADAAYRKAKASKAVQKLVVAGKIPRPPKALDAKKAKQKKPKGATANPVVEGDSKKKPGLGRKPGVTRKSFKSKSRFKRRK